MKLPEPGFSLDELLAELGRHEPVDGYRTSAEWAEALDLTEYRMVRLMRAAHKAGKLSSAREWREAMDGIKRPVAVYAFKFESKN